MRRLSLLLGAGLIVGLFCWLAWWRRDHAAGTPAAPRPAAVASQPASTDPVPPVSPPSEETARAAEPAGPDLRRLTYGTAWNAAAQPPPLVAFRDWVERYFAAGSPAARAALEPEGRSLAQARRAAMRALIEHDPHLALALTVPAAIRPLLPAAILAEVESRFSARGDFSVLVVDYSLAELARRRASGLSTEPYHHAVEIDGREYPAFVYGRRAAQTTKHGLPLHGVMLDGVVALHESPLRLIEPGEAIPADAPGGAVRAELSGRWLGFASAAELLAGEARQAAAERGLGPDLTRIPDPAQPTTAVPAAGEIIGDEAPATAWTIGAKQVLVIRVDFSDLTGEPRRGSTTYTQAYVQNLADTLIAPYYAKSSFGQTSLVTTVTAQTYRMPQTAASYATAYANTQLHTDARAAAAANYAVDTFDRILVLFTSLGSISGSQITYGGLAQVSGKNSWINGAFDFRVVAHELGHTYGLRHANLWKVTDGNAVSAAGASTEYGDDFDTMGANYANDQRTDFNPWFKNLLGWANDTQVRAVTTSGTYRLNRFDNATGTGTLALKVTRDATRNYWIGVRRNFTTNAAMQHGAYVIWGYNTNQQSNLLDLTTPGTSVTDAALAVGATLLDTVGNVSLRPAAEGGTAPDEYLDVQVTVGLNGIPVIDTPPASQGFIGGATVTLSVAASGAAPLAYQWRKNGADLPGATSATYTIANAQAGDAGSYAVRVSNAIGSVVSSAAVIGLNSAPMIATQPLHTAATVGRTVTLSLGTTGFPAPTIQWRKNSSSVTGATNTTLSFTSAQATDAGTYDAVVTNSLGSVLTQSATVSIYAASTPPTNDNFANAWVLPPNLGTALGSNAGATGETGEPSHWNASGTASSVWYRWTPAVSGTAQIDTIGSGFDTVLAVYTGSSVTALTKIGEDDQGGGLNTSKLVFNVTAGTTYSIAVGDWTSTHPGGSIVLSYFVAVAPTITTQPVSQIAAVGGGASFSVAATGTSPGYQWFRNGAALAGATNSTLNLSNLTPADAGSYYVVISNLAGSVTSSVVTLSGSNAAPTITTQPAAVLATAGQSATLTVTASGTGTLSYQWRRNGFLLPGATAATFALPGISRTDADNYDVIVASGLSATVSQPARVRVAPTGYPELVAPDPAWELRPEAALGIFGYAIAPLSDGRAYIAGSFVSIDNVRRAGLARLNADGTVDPTFLPPEIDNTIRAVLVQPDGKIVIGGDFVRVNGLLRNRVARLNADGSIDATFNAGTAANATVYALARQSDGRILVAGNFTAFAGSNRNFLARLNADGTLDPGYLNRGFTGTVFALAVQGDGKLVAGGSFSTGFVDAAGTTVSRTRLARLNSDGTIDSTLAPSLNGTVNAMVLQSDGQIVIGGAFTTVDGTTVGRIARLGSTGALDPAFNTATGGGFTSTVSALALDSSGRILAGGSFSFFGSGTAFSFVRLTGAGARDTGFLTQGFSSSVTSIGVLPSGGILVGGGFASYYNSSGATTTRVRFARLNSDGTLHAAVNFSVRAAGTINAIVPLPAGRMLVAGFFNTMRGAAVPNSVLRINPDGSVDPAFNPGGTGANSNTYAALAQPDGKLVITGAFTTYNGTAAAGLARLNEDGTLDPAFSVGAGLGTLPGYTLALLPAGRVFVGGSFTAVNNVSRARVAVLTGTGAVDASFDPGAGASGSVYCSAVLPDGKILIGGAFTTYGGTTVGRLARLNPGGTLDPTFNSGSAGAGSDVYAILVQPDGKIVIGGAFTTYNGATRTGLARLTSTGALDTTFTPPTVNNVHGVLVQEDGRVVVRGSFADVGGASGTAFVARLNSDGTRDTAFAAGGFTTSNAVPSVMAMDDGGQLFMQSTGSPGLSATIAATLPVITTQPASQTAPVGGTVTLSVVAGSMLPQNYQWWRDGTPIPGAIDPTLALTNLTSAAAGNYTVAITNELGTTTSAAAALTVATPPAIVTQPAAQITAVGLAATFSVVATGTPAPTYQWRKGGVAIAGATHATLALTNVQSAAAGAYSVVVTNAGGSVTSQDAALAVSLAPLVATAPAGQSVSAGANVTLSVTAGGVAPLAYQWSRNGVALSGATNATLTLSSVTTAATGRYAVTITNSAGSVTSDAAVLLVQSGTVSA
ncbi:MAG: immunoglobulin domain-containing protein, partial [Verrucomicrobia bacterium]|nr:immunoglobulin domain-containing protein [Verrucomicrobiota bacterium]